MRKALLTALLIGLLAVPASAGAATRWVVKGGGWGHGIGMSQYGAHGMAREGKNYRQIIGHYYTGTEIGQAQTRTIRVLLQTNRSRVSFTGASAAGDRSLDPKKTYVARVRGGGVDLRDNRGKRVGTFGAPLVVRASAFRLGGTAMNGVSSGTYHDNLELRPSQGGGLTAVNAVGLDNYVQGVVPGEMPSSWHPEALKAQVLAARSYALVTDKGGDVFDQYPDTRSQVYRGVTGEAASTNSAVRATAGEVVTHDGKVAVTYFFSTSGGHTENIENVWGGNPVPYLKGVEDPGDKLSPRHRWTFKFTTGSMNAKLRRYLKGGRLKSIKVRKRGVSPRIVSADVIGTRGRTRVTGSTLRQALGVHDNWMSFKKVSTSATRKSSSRAKEGLGSMVFGGGRGLVGVISPSRRGDKVYVDRRDRRGKWRRATTGRIGSRGSYRIAVKHRGVYRVKARGIVGPAVRVR